jgi:GTP cyclohydrolase IA
VASKAISWSEIYARLTDAPPGRLFGIPRGGSIVAGLTGRAVDHVEEADWLVDDVVDSKATANAWASRFGKPVWALFDRQRDELADRQLIMPWEPPTTGQAQRVSLERIGLELIETLGYDPTTEGLRNTPSRWARWWQEFLAPDPARLDSTFEVSESGRMVVVSGMRMWSICEHHLMPFAVDVSIGYVPHGKVLGLSKFARLSLHAAHRLQLQERLASEIADTTEVAASSADVAILVCGRHLCMEARGVKVRALASSLVTRGAFEKDPSLRAEFIALQNVTSPRSADPIEVLHQASSIRRDH